MVKLDLATKVQSFQPTECAGCNVIFAHLSLYNSVAFCAVKGEVRVIKPNYFKGKLIRSHNFGPPCIWKSSSRRTRRKKKTEEWLLLLLLRQFSSWREMNEWLNRTFFPWQLKASSP